MKNIKIMSSVQLGTVQHMT